MGHLHVLGDAGCVSAAVGSSAATVRVFPHVPAPVTCSQATAVMLKNISWLLANHHCQHSWGSSR